MVSARLMSRVYFMPTHEGPIVAWTRRGSSNPEGSRKRRAALRPATLGELQRRRFGIDALILMYIECMPGEYTKRRWFVVIWQKTRPGNCSGTPFCTDAMDQTQITARFGLPLEDDFLSCISLDFYANMNCFLLKVRMSSCDHRYCCKLCSRAAILWLTELRTRDLPSMSR
jgi:hypothetical protein